MADNQTLITDEEIAVEAAEAAELSERTRIALHLLGLDDYKPAWGPIGETVFNRTYPRTLNSKAIWKAQDLGLPVPKPLKETFAETCVRMVDGNLGLVDQKFIEPDERLELLRLALDFSILPGGRHYSSSGVKDRQFLFNCHAAGWDPEEPWAHFTFLFDELMQGGGVGSNYSNRYLSKMPKVNRNIDLHITCRRDHADIAEFVDVLSVEHDHEMPIFDVPDTREGWVDAVDFILRSAFDQSSTKESVLTVDVSGIRKKGTPLRTSGGIACGPGPLVFMLRDLVAVVNSCAGRSLTSLDAMRMDHAIAACVVAGGKRRSSRMSVKNWRDPDIFEFINCKQHDGAHWTTNISVEIDDDFLAAYGDDVRRIISEVEPFTSPSRVCAKCFLNVRADSESCVSCDHTKAREVMRAVVLGKRLNGEPGLWNRSLAMQGEREPEEMFCPNPCGEIGLHMWENCNLGHVNLQKYASRPPSKMYEAFRLMSRFLLRATFGDIPQKRQRKVVDKNRRIGVGFLGFHGWLALQGIKYSECHSQSWVREKLMMAREVVVKTAREYAVQQDIHIPVANTALAPTGTIVNMPGVSGSGQATKMAYGIRRVRYFDSDPELKVKIEEGYHHYPDPDAKNTTIVDFWFEDPLVERCRMNGLDPSVVESEAEIPFETSLAVQAMMQQTYADNAISFTICLPEDKMPNEDEMEKQLVRYLPFLKGTTVFVDKTRANAPFERITKEQFEAYTGRKQIQQIEDECKNGCPVK